MANSAVKDFFWPPVVQGDYLDAARKRCLLVISIAVAVVGLFSGLIGFENAFALYPVQTLIAVLSPLVFLICPFLIARADNVRNVAWFFLIYSYMGLVSVPLIAGGLFSYSNFYMLPWVVMATLFLGWKQGIGAAFVIFGTYMTLHLMRGSIPVGVYEISRDMISNWLLWGLSLTLIMLTTGAAIFQREMERAAVKLSEARIEAETANKAKSDFLARMSHEIRTPMNGVLGMAEMLDTTELTDQQRLYAKTISTSGQSLLTIINDILDLSKIEAGHLPLECKPFELKHCIDDLAVQFELSAAQKQIGFHVDYDDTLPTQITGDAGRLRQILINLIGNALKFTEEGQVTLSVNGSTSGTMADLIFTISDTGIGIPAEKLGEIFHKFEQVEGSLTRRFDGAGLGLAISRQLAHAMGGTLSVRSNFGEGCTFSFEARFPLVHDTAAMAGETGRSNVPKPSQPALGKSNIDLQTRRPRILAAEDNEINRLVLDAMIDKDKYELVYAEDGLEALNAFKTSSFDIVLMDMSMPRMDGLLATKEIRQFELENNLERKPIICLTAHAFRDQRDKSLANGMDDYLSKPVSKGRIDSMLEKWIKTAESDRNVA